MKDILRSPFDCAVESNNRVRRDERSCPWLSRHDLELDVMRIENQLLDVNIAIAERFFRFGFRGVK